MVSASFTRCWIYGIFAIGRYWKSESRDANSGFCYCVNRYRFHQMGSQALHMVLGRYGFAWRIAYIMGGICSLDMDSRGRNRSDYVS